MDDPALEADRHRDALRGLRRLHLISGTVGALWAPLRAVAAHTGQRRLRVLDIATGGGDIPIGLWQMARRAGGGLALEIDGCDRSARAVALAADRARRTGTPVRFFTLDALVDPLPEGYDVLISSLFLHHLADDETAGLLRRMAQAAGRMVLIADLARSPRGWLLVTLGTRLLSRSSVVHHDGAQSIRAAYTLDEIRALAQRAGLDGCQIHRRWPCHFLLKWRPATLGLEPIPDPYPTSPHL